MPAALAAARWLRACPPRAALPSLRRSLSAMATSADAADPIVQYVVLRRDLWDGSGGGEAWPLGAVVAQGCHAATAALWAARDTPDAAAYCALDAIDGMRKVVLEAPDAASLTSLASALTDAGANVKLWVEQPENVPTALAAGPARKSTLAPLLKRLPLCRGVVSGKKK